MISLRFRTPLLLASTLLGACAANEDTRTSSDVPPDASLGTDPDAQVSAEGGRDAAVDATSTADAFVPCATPGQRLPANDGCNWCDCRADGTTSCSTRVCPTSPYFCEYGGIRHPYAEKFNAADGCNKCVCAMSGLACTRRSCSTAEEGAILLESLSDTCGGIATLTGQHALDYLGATPIVAPFHYDRDRIDYPETRADTTLTFRPMFDNGFIVCRIPQPGQEAIDLELKVELTTEDGAFDEGLHSFLTYRRSQFRDAADFVDGRSMIPFVHGAYTPNCFDPAGITYSAEFHPDGHSAIGRIAKACETDISLEVGNWTQP